MTTKDITRFLHQPPKHYAAVRIQQGRVLLDSDLNESARLEESERTRTFSSILGTSASPDVGFTLGRALPTGVSLQQATQLRAGHFLPVREVSLNGVKTNIHAVSLRAGTIYLGGMRFELGEPETIAFQRGYLQMKASDFPSLVLSPSPSPYSPASPESPQFPEFHNFYYLNAWEQCVSAVEDEEFLERALSGADTSVRVRRMRRVELLTLTNPFINSCAEAWEEVIQRLEVDNAFLDRGTGELRSKGRLALRFVSVPPTECPPCATDREAEYLGPDNETLRIMLTGPNTYVWTADNGAPLYRVKVTGLSGDPAREAEAGGDGAPDPNEGEEDDDSDEDEDVEDEPDVKVELLNPPRDDEHAPRRHRVVEILPFAALIEDGDRERRHDPHFSKVAAEIGVFTRVANYNDDKNTFTIDKNVGVQALRDLVHQWDRNHPASSRLNIVDPETDARYFYVRFWHQADRVEDIELTATNDPNAPPLADTGIVPMFPSAGRRGDTWTATLRPDTPERIVPFDLLTQPGGVPPHGPRHFYAPLSLLDGDNTTVTRVEDCRPRIHRLTDRGCATFTVGDGLLSIGDFQKIQDAIDALPIEGGRVSLLPGLYPELLTIEDRKGVILEGCGATTIITSPTPVSTPLIQITGTETAAITISNLTLQVGEQVGISVTDASSVNISGVTMITGIVDDTEGFEAGPSDEDILVISASQAPHLSLQSLDIRAERRPAIRIEGCDDATLRGLTCSGNQPSSSSAPNLPLISVVATKGVRILDSTLAMKGATQFGDTALRLDAEVSDAELSGLDITVQSYTQPGEPDTFFQVPMAIDIDGSTHVRLERSHLTQMGAPEPERGDHAALVVQGSDLMITDNHVECVNRATWGGVWIRGFSSDVELRGNRIEGGLGHGITLGSTTWVQAISEPLQRAGIGRSQVGNDGGFFIEYDLNPITLENAPSTDLFPFPDGALTSVRLVDNRIEDMGGNGISVPVLVVPPEQVIGLGSPTLFVLKNSVIQGNSITGNIKTPGSYELVDLSAYSLFPELLQNPPGTDPILPALPLGGIVLDACFGVEIRENAIFENGPLLEVGEGTNTVRPFAGIFALTGDNLVIAGNRISQNGPIPDAESTLPPGIRAAIAVLLAGNGELNDTLDSIEGMLDDGGTGVDSAGVAVRVTNNSVQQPEGRALEVIAIGPVTVDGNFLASSGNHVAGSAREAGDVVFIRSHGGAWERVNIDPVGFSPATPFSYKSFVVPLDTGNYLLDGENIDIVGPYGLGGQILFNNNQVTYDWNFKQQPDSPDEAEEPISHAPIALFSLDHISVCSNQCALRLSGTQPEASPGVEDAQEPIATHLLAVGATVQIERNRFSEEVGTVFASGFATARLLSSASFNQSTHILVTRQWTIDGANQNQFHRIDFGNQVLFMRVDFSPDEDTSRVEFAISQYYAFLWTDTTPNP